MTRQPRGTEYAWRRGLGAAALALVLAAAACTAAPAREAVQEAPARLETAAPAIQTAPEGEPSGGAGEEQTPAPTPEPAATSSGGAVAPRPAAPSAPRPPAPTVVRVRIPALAVDAPILQMGVDAAGVMEIPQSPSTVAWYGFTALPGTSGNAVMAGHVTWGGARAVFYQLQNLRPGDSIEVQTGDGGLRYAVQRTYLVRPEEADIANIIGPRDGPQTLTLITCGGTFDSGAREYDHRVIVFATRI